MPRGISCDRAFKLSSRILLISKHFTLVNPHPVAQTTSGGHLLINFAISTLKLCDTSSSTAQETTVNNPISMEILFLASSINIVISLFSH